MPFAPSKTSVRDAYRTPNIKNGFSSIYKRQRITSASVGGKEGAAQGIACPEESRYNRCMTIDLKLFGPIATLAGTWQGGVGKDTAPDGGRVPQDTPFREQIVFTPIGAVGNHEQVVHVLSYTRTVWRLRDDVPFHLQLGYWLWDAASKQVMHSFMIPRGLTVLAGGNAEPDSTVLRVSAVVGSSTFGICSNPFLDREFRTVRYESTLTLNSPHSFSYEEDTQIQMKGREAIFHHSDKNSLEKTKEPEL
jgi:hypothetical protein